MLKWLDRNFEEVICCTGIALIACCVFAQVIARYAFGVALRWTEEVATISMVWSVYMGASLCVRERFHIRILVGVTSLPSRLGRYVIFAADLVWALFCVLMLKVGVDYLKVFWKFPELSPGLGLNQFYPQSIIVIGYALMLLRLIQSYRRWWREGGHGLPGMLDEDLAETLTDKEHAL